jgi:hypothetical protein
MQQTLSLSVHASSPLLKFLIRSPCIAPELANINVDEVKVLRNGEHFILPASIVVAPAAKTRRTWPEEETELIRQALVETIVSLCAKEEAGGGIVSLALANVSRCDHLTWRGWAENKVRFMLNERAVRLSVSAAVCWLCIEPPAAYFQGSARVVDSILSSIF